MSAAIIDGKAFAERLRGQVAEGVTTLKAGHGIIPGLAVVLVGENPASQVYVANKARQTKECGMASFEYTLPESASQTEVLALVAELNRRADVHGILVQLPLPKQIDEKAVIAAITPEKDVDGFHILNQGKLFAGLDGLVPCTPLGCLMLLKDRLGSLAGKHAVVVGRSNIVGKPMAALLLKEDCTVTIAHSKTHDLPAVCREADIVVAAVGRPKMITGDWLKPGAVVIDVGINRITDGDKTRLVGDVDFDSAQTVASAITPVPGGVGPMTIACLLANTLSTCKAAHGVS